MAAREGLRVSVAGKGMYEDMCPGLKQRLFAVVIASGLHLYQLGYSLDGIQGVGASGLALVRVWPWLTQYSCRSHSTSHASPSWAHHE